MNLRTLFGVLCAAIFLSLLGAAVGRAFAQDACLRPLCTNPGNPNYAGRDGTDASGPYGVCNSSCGFLQPCSHTLEHCPAGSTLVPGAGQCRLNACGGGGCEVRPLCTDPRAPYMSGSDGHDASGALGACGAPCSGPGACSHTLEHCPAGFTLLPNSGVCQRCPISMTTGGVRGPGPGYVLLPDLVIRTTWLRIGASPAHVGSVPRGRPYLACFVVANIGPGASGPFRVGGGGLGVPTGPYQDHAGLAAGASREGCLAYPTTPTPGAYRTGISADSLRAVAETREDNNGGILPVLVTP